MAARKPASKGSTSKAGGSAKNASKSALQQSARSSKAAGVAAGKMMKPSSGGHANRVFKGANPGADVLVRDFHPGRGVAVLEFGGERVRYRVERSEEQVFAVADYLRARRGFSTDQEMADVLGVHRTRLIAWKQGTDLPSPQNAQLLAHIAVVVHQLREFLDPDVIPDWLVTEQYTLQGRTPVEALRAGQLAEVLQNANATEHGAFV